MAPNYVIFIKKNTPELFWELTNIVTEIVI